MKEYNEERLRELTYKVLLENKEGQEWLAMMEYKHFYSPVCPPGCKEGHGYFNEGANNLIRWMRGTALDVLNNGAKLKQKEFKRQSNQGAKDE